MSLKKVGIVGATGYTGSELVRLLAFHPNVKIEAISSESYAGEAFSAVHPFFKNIIDITLIPLEELLKKDLDIVFLALPHGVSMEVVKKLGDRNIRIIDLSGDFRLNDAATYESWYKKTHTFREGFEKAVYGLPELFGEAIAKASLIANPGCYPTSAILALAPLIAEKIVAPEHIIIDSKSGTTGTGVKAKPVNHFSSVNENFKAYGLKYHRHTIEIEQVLSKSISASVQVQFTPHLLPIDRGILSTVYAKPRVLFRASELRSIYNNFYKNQPFIRLLDTPPAVKQVRGSNFCDLYFTYDERTRTIIVLSAIDNLMKGAAGQAVHNMNLMLDFPATAGLQLIPIHP